MVGIGVIGYGYWGPNLVRNLGEQRGAKVVAVSDLRANRLELAQARYPYIYTTTDHKKLFEDPSIDAIAISTPVGTHFDLGMQALEAGKHVLLEKPLAASSDEAQRLIDTAEKRQRVLMVDHTFVNLGLFQPDVNVVWDLAVHDLAIMQYVLPDRPVAVSATGLAHVPGGVENIAYLTLFYNTKLISHLHVNWLSPVKVRSTLIGGSSKMIVYDDMEISEKIKVYDRGITMNQSPENLYKILVNYRMGDMWAPQLDTTEALGREMAHFIKCVEGQEQPETGGCAGLDVVRILEAAEKSIRERGRPIELA
jgi:predicted dehydrogenase